MAYVDEGFRLAGVLPTEFPDRLVNSQPGGDDLHKTPGYLAIIE
jgi:hypothetical protein